MNNKTSLGKHYLAEMFDCDSKTLNNLDKVAQILRKAAEIGGATVLDFKFHQFSPQGVSGMVLISESHLAIHTWPEHAFASVDLFTCGHKLDSKASLQYISRQLGAARSEVSKIDRGIL